MRSVLVTGANGFIGRAVSVELIRNNYDIRCVVRKPFQLEGAKILTIPSLAEQFNWSDLLNGVECVIHTAARVHIHNEKATNPLEEFRKVNVEGTLNLARQAANSGVKRFIFLSSVKVNGEVSEPNSPFKVEDSPNPQDDYGLSKYEAEQGLFLIGQKSGMEIVVIRPPLVYGPGVKANFASMMNILQRGIPLPFGAIKNKRSMVFIDNLVSLIQLCIGHPLARDHIFFVSDGNDISTTELLSACAHALNVKARLLAIPQKWLEFGARLFGKKDIALRLCGSLQVDISKTRDYLGWIPPVSMTDGLRATAENRSLKT